MTTKNEYYPESKYDFETGIYRPPSEGGSASLLVRLTRNCPWNHCTFCAMYKSEKFELRSPKEIIEDINRMHSIYLELNQMSQQQGTNGEFTTPVAAHRVFNHQVFNHRVFNHRVFNQFFKKNPELYFHNGINMLFNWFSSGAKTVFLQDADSLIMKTDHLIRVLKHLKKTFPTIERITTYARSRTIARKPDHDLLQIQKAGLDRVHIGLETGDPAVLKKIKKGATPQDHIKGGQKAIETGFQVSEYWMPGLGGTEMSEGHAKNTAHVLNQINPHYIRSRPFTPRPGSPLYEKTFKNEQKRMSPKAQLLEIKQMLTLLDVTSKVCFDHAGNYWKLLDGRYLLSHSYEGYQFPDKKEHLLKLIELGIASGQHV